MFFRSSRGYTSAWQNGIINSSCSESCLSLLCLEMDSGLTLRFMPPELDFPFHNSLKNQLPVLGLAGPSNNVAPKRTVLVPRGRRSSTHHRRLIVRAEIHSPIEGVSDDLNLIASRNLDFAYTRRKVRSAFTQVQLQLDHCLFTVLFSFKFLFLSWDLDSYLLF